VVERLEAGRLGQGLLAGLDVEGKGSLGWHGCDLSDDRNCGRKLPLRPISFKLECEGLVRRSERYRLRATMGGRETTIPAFAGFNPAPDLGQDWLAQDIGSGPGDRLRHIF